MYTRIILFLFYGLRWSYLTWVLNVISPLPRAVPDTWKAYTQYGNNVAFNVSSDGVQFDELQYVVFSSIPPELLRHEKNPEERGRHCRLN
jgi:hypothetical protein